MDEIVWASSDIAHIKLSLYSCLVITFIFSFVLCDSSLALSSARPLYAKQPTIFDIYGYSVGPKKVKWKLGFAIF